MAEEGGRQKAVKYTSFLELNLKTDKNVSHLAYCLLLTAYCLLLTANCLNCQLFPELLEQWRVRSCVRAKDELYLHRDFPSIVTLRRIN